MKLSLCVICKDEEKKIGRCIESVKDYVDEIIVVDTGSGDNTINIVKSLGAKVFEIKWEKDFAKARNYALDKASGDWIIFLDADEYVLEEDRKYIRSYVIEAINRNKQAILVEMLNIGDNSIKSVFSTIRLFENNPQIRYTGKIHEIISGLEGYCVKKLKFKEPLRVLHDGYSEQAYKEKDKKNRNLELLLKEYNKNPRNGNICYYLIDTYQSMGELQKASEYCEKALKYGGTLVGYKEMLYTKIIEIYTALHKDRNMIKKMYEEAIIVNNEYPDFDFRYGYYLYNDKYYEESIQYLDLCLEKVNKYQGMIKSIAMGNIFIIYTILAHSYIMLNKDKQAIPILIKILRIDKYEYNSLYNLISIVSKVESAENLGVFLEKLYDIYNVKDQEVLKLVSKKVGNNELMTYFENRIKTIVGSLENNMC